MNYFLEITSKPEYALKYSKDNPQVDNDLDLGNFVKPELVTKPLVYLDAKNGVISFDKLTRYDAVTAVSGGIIISRRFKEVLEKAFPYDLQFFPALIDFQGQQSGDFFVMNVYNKIPCYNLEMSVYEKSPVDGSYEFEKIIPVSGMLEEYGVEYNIVRSSHDNKIVVSEQFKKLAAENEINSLDFAPEYVMEW